MNILRLLSVWQQNHRLPEWAEQIARPLVEPIWSSARQRVQSMSHHEARGYIRVRYRSLVAQAVRQHLAAHPDRVISEGKLQETACESLLRMLTERRTATRPAAMAARRAA